MKFKKSSLLFFLLIIVLSVAIGLSAYLTKQHAPLSLKLNITCLEFVSDGTDESGNWVSMGSGAEITLYGKLNYNLSATSNLKRVIAKIVVHDIATGIQLNDEFSLEFDREEPSVFTKELVISEQVEMPSCTDYKYGIAFYSSTGKLIPHKGDLENSIENLQYFLYSTPTY